MMRANEKKQAMDILLERQADIQSRPIELKAVSL